MSATLQGMPREKLGSRFARRLRAQGRIPASVQGENKPNVHLSIDEHAFLAARRHHEHLFDIEVEGGETETALVRELQWGPLGERIAHVEFRRVVRGQKTEVEVELEFTGHPKGGVLNHLVTHVTVLALPSDIPDRIEINVSEMDEDHSLHASDLELPEGVELVTEPGTQVAVVVAVREEVPEPEEGEEAAEEAAAAPEGEAPEAGEGEESEED